MSRSFDGTDDFVTATGYKGVTGTGARTVLGWFKCSHSASNGQLIAWGDSSGVNAGRSETFSIESGVFWGRHNQSRVWSAGTGFGDNNWHSFALTLGDSKTNGDRKVYLDFSQRTPSFTNPTTAINTLSDVDLRIGTSLNGTVDYNGLLAHIQLFNVQLSEYECYQALRFPGSITRGLQLFWPLLGSSPEGDYSGNARNGTVTGALVSSNNPPINGIYYPRINPWMYAYTEPAAAGGLSIPVAMSEYRRRRVA